MSWTIRLGVYLDENPRIRAAGYDAESLLSWLLRLCVRRGWEGVIPAAYARPEYVAEQRRLPVELVDAALQALEREDIVRRIDGGDLEIQPDDDWDQPTSDKVRKRQERKRKSRASRGVTRGHAKSGEVTASPRSSAKSRSGSIPDPDPEDPPFPPSGGTCESGDAGGKVAAAGAGEADRVLGSILARLGENLGRELGATEARREMVAARLADGMTERDLLLVLWSKCKGPRRWLGHPERSEHLTPETLLGKHCQKYLEQARAEYLAAKGTPFDPTGPPQDDPPDALSAPLTAAEVPGRGRGAAGTRKAVSAREARPRSAAGSGPTPVAEVIAGVVPGGAA